MAEPQDQAVVLLSIHQQYADAILAGEKRVELRKTAFARDVSHVLLYVTSPLRRVVGYFEVASIRKAAPSALWRQYRRVSGVPKHHFDAYYGGCPEGIAIRIGAVRALGRQVRLDEIGVRAPQSFAYVEASVFETVRVLGLR